MSAALRDYINRCDERTPSGSPIPLRKFAGQKEATVGNVPPLSDRLASVALHEGDRMNERGWTTRESDLLAIRFMDWIDTYQASGRIPAAITFYPDDELTPAQSEALKETITDLRSRGLIDGQDMLAGPLMFGAMLTAYGTEMLRARQQRRRSKRARLIAARDALLDWLYENSDERGQAEEFEQFAGTTSGHFEGEPFTVPEIIAAATFLHDTGFVEGVKVWSEWPVIKPALTPKGLSAVEAERYTAEPDTPMGDTFSMSFSGDNNGQIAQGHSARQQQSVGVDAVTLSGFVAEISAALSALSERDQGAGEAYLDLIEAEAAADEPNTGVIAAALRGLRSLSDKVSTAAVGVGVGALAAYAKSRLGLPELGDGS